MKSSSLLLFAITCVSAQAALANHNVPGRVPDEIEREGGPHSSFSHGGAAAAPTVGSIRSSPGMLAFEKRYEFSGSYIWPSLGRDFYQLGVLDSKTSSVGAGFLYTGFRTGYKAVEDLTNRKEQEHAYYDSPLKRRMSLALAKTIANLGVGMNVQMVESGGGSGEKKSGITLGLGFAGLLLKKLRFALSVENLANKDIRNMAPLTYRGGLAYLINRDVTLHLDYRQRQRVDSELKAFNDSRSGNYDSFERMVILSSSIRVQNLLRVLVGYGMEPGGKRKTVSGGLAVVNDKATLSYLVYKPYMSKSEIQHAIHLDLRLAI